MRCPFCQKGIMERYKDVISEDNMEFDALKCIKCGEEIITMKQLNILASKYRKLRQAKDITFAKWGNSIAVRIPSEIATEFKLSPGKHGILSTEKGKIKIIPST